MAKIYGLTVEEVAERKRAGQDNRAIKSPAKSDWEIIRGNIFTYFNLVFVILAVILLLVGSYRDLTFLPIIIINTLTGIVQELRSKRELEKLTVLNSPKAKVIRDGKRMTIPTDEIVVDDVICLKAGDQIPVDAKMMEGELAVNEALLTGEADEIVKREGGELMSGSFVVSGEGVAVTTRVGEDAYAAQLTLRAKAIKGGEQSEILKSLNKIMTILGVLVVPLGIAMFSEQVFMRGEGLQESVRAMVAAILGMIPEGLFLLATATLAISVMRLARREVLVHEMKSIETLARVDVLCVDKTGTITEDKMAVEEVVEIAEGGEAVLAEFVRRQKADNATMEALKGWRKQSKVGGIELGEVKKVYGFSSKYKYSAVEFLDGKYVLGAPELVLGKAFRQYKARIERYSSKGYRVLIFGKYVGELGVELTGEVEVLAMVVVKNRVRETAPATFRYFAEQGVEVKVISGDNPLTVSEVAKQVGIPGAEKYVDVTELSGRELAKTATECVVFGRVTPEKKRKLVKALQKAGHTVAMTGDGVNDVLALKDADCSVAMASGAQAAVQVAQLVLVDSDFSSMPEVVKEGRRVVNNLERSGSLFLVKNMFSVTMAILAITMAVKYPLVPNQLTWVTMWTIGIPSFLLAQMPNHRLIKGNFITNIMSRAFWGALGDVLVVGVIMVVGHWMGWSALQVGTGCAVGMAMVGMAYLYAISRPLDTWRRVVVVGCLVGLVATALLMPETWNFVPMW